MSLSPRTHTMLKARQPEIRGGFPENLALPVHRAPIWILFASVFYACKITTIFKLLGGRANTTEA